MGLFLYFAYLNFVEEVDIAVGYFDLQFFGNLFVFVVFANFVGFDEDSYE